MIPGIELICIRLIRAVGHSLLIVAVIVQRRVRARYEARWC